MTKTNKIHSSHIPVGKWFGANKPLSDHVYTKDNGFEHYNNLLPRGKATKPLYFRYTLIFKLILGIVILTLPNLLFGQFTQDSVPAFDTVTVEQDQDIDSSFFLVLNRYGNSIELPRDETDSTWNYWEHIPAYAGDNLYLTTGNTGAPATSAYWKAIRQVGFDHGVHHMDLYRIESNDLKYYSTDRAYTMVHYNQTPQQTKSGTNIKLGRAFDTKSGITIQYDRINDLGEFDHQKTRQTSVAAGLYIFPASNKKIFFSYVSNNFTLEENGGIESYTFYDDPTYDDRSVIPINIENSLATIKEREARINASWNITNRQDSTARGLSLLYDVRYGQFDYKYADPDTLPFVYEQYAVHVDGQRATVGNNIISNKVGLAIDYGTKSKFDGQLTAQLEHRFNRYTQDFASKDITNLILHGGFDQRLSDLIRLNTNLQLDLGDQRGDYLINASVTLRPSKNILIQGQLISQLKTPTGIQSAFSTLGTEIYSNNFNPSKYNTLRGRIEFKNLGLSAEISNSIATDHVFFNDALIMENISSSFNIFQLKAGLTRKLGPLYSENYIFFQNSSDSRVPLPTYFSKHYLGAKWKLFKKRLQLDTGADVIILPDFDGYGYFPLTGGFYPNQTAAQYNYTLNGIIGLRVDQFNVYFKLENMHTIWDQTPRSLIEYYPIHDFRLRIGFRWLLRG